MLFESMKKSVKYFDAVDWEVYAMMFIFAMFAICDEIVKY